MWDGPISKHKESIEHLSQEVINFFVGTLIILIVNILFSIYFVHLELYLR